MKSGFRVTYEIVTPESAEDGDVEERGFIDPSLGAWNVSSEEMEEEEYAVSDFETDLRRAIDIAQQAPNSCECIEASDSDHASARWVTYVGSQNFYDGAAESRSIHFPENTTPASRARLVKLITNH